MKRATDSATWTRAARAAALVVLAAGLGSCAKQPPPQKPFIHTTKAFDAIFGALPPLSVPAPCHAAVAYLPSARDEGRFRPVPLFSAEQGNEELVAIGAVVRGTGAGELPGEVDAPFPAGSELESVSYQGGVALVKVGGTFRARGLPREKGVRAAEALALTVAQFGKATAAELTDAQGEVRFTGRADEARTGDPGPPRVLRLEAVRNRGDRTAGVLSVLFDRPVFVDAISFGPAGGGQPFPGSAYATGFGMAVEFRPDPKIAFDATGRYRLRLSVRDGKGRRLDDDRDWTAQAVAGE